MDWFVEWLDRVHGFRPGRKWPFQGSLRVYGDPAGKARNAETGRSQWHVVYNKLDKAKIPFKAYHGVAHPPVVDRVEAVQEALYSEGEYHVLIDGSCTNLLRDLAMVSSNGGKPEKESDPLLSHSSDAFGYWVYKVRKVRKLSNLGPGYVYASGG